MKLEVPGAVVDFAVVDDPLLGPAHVITCGASSTTMSAIDWDRPTRIPTVAAPGKLAPGAGGAIMNAIAERALAAGVRSLRYAGRYPTAALFRTLLRSFRTSATEEEFTRHFRLAGDAVEIPIDFMPAPFTRLTNPHGFVEMRDGRIERAVVDRVSFEPGGSPARLTRGGAELWFGDQLYAQIAAFDASGALIDGPHPIPKCESEVIGKSFPPQLVAALAELVAEAVPTPIADDARAFTAGASIIWADLGAKPAALAGDGLLVHAILWDCIAPLGLARLALALAEALAPVVTLALVDRIARDVALISPPA